jgi:hypothetical protein
MEIETFNARTEGEQNPTPTPVYDKEEQKKHVPKTGKRGAPQAFAHILFDMLENHETTVDWTKDGLAFLIKSPGTFASETLDKYFNHKNVSSFQR